MNKCSQRRITRGFSLIVDDYGHRKRGNFRDGVGRKYIGEIGTRDTGIVVVTTHHIYMNDGSKSLALDIAQIPHPKLPQREITERKNPREHKNKHMQ
jgi:hypothetical protein